jgi:hypothetical protein
MTDDFKSMDLYEILTKPVLEMSDEELEKSIAVLREQRKVKISSTKGKTGLDLLLGKLTPQNARAILAQLEGEKK